MLTEVITLAKRKEKKRSSLPGERGLEMSNFMTMNGNNLRKAGSQYRQVYFLHACS